MKYRIAAVLVSIGLLWFGAALAQRGFSVVGPNVQNPLRIVMACSAQIPQGGVTTGGSRFMAISRLPCAFGGPASEVSFCYDNHYTTVTGGSVLTFGSITAGTGGTDGTYDPVFLTGGNGDLVQAQVVVSGGGVTSLSVDSGGNGYLAGDVLSANSTSIGGVTGFSVPVATVTAPGSGTDLNNTQAVTLQGVAFESDALGITVPATFGGSLTTIMAIGASQICTDPIYPSQFGLSQFAADSIYWIRTWGQMPGIGIWMVGSQANYTGAASYAYPVADNVNQVYYHGPLTQPNKGFPMGIGPGVSFAFGPSAAIGRFVGCCYPSFYGMGDSWSSGTNDQNPTQILSGIGVSAHAVLGNLGAVSGVIAYTQTAKGGTAAIDYVGYPAKALWPMAYANMAFIELGRNDLAGGETPAQTLANLQILNTRLRAAGVSYVMAMTMPANSTSTDQWLTLVNQTPNPLFNVSPAIGAQMNTLLAAALAAGQFDAVLPETALRDSTNIWIWHADGVTVDGWTRDGLHPVGTGMNSYNLVGQEIRAILQGFRPGS